MSNYKVLFVHKFFTPDGGVERVHKNLSNALADAGVESMFYVHDTQGESAKGFAGLSEQYKAMSPGPHASLATKVSELFGLIKTHHINVLISATETANLLALLCKVRFPALRVIYTRHCAFDVSDQKLPPWAIKALYTLYSVTNGKIVAVSDALKRQIQSSLIVGKDEVSFIPNAVLQPAIQSLAEQTPQMSLPKKYFCAVGRLVEQKGFDLLLQAYAKARASTPALPELVIVGTGEDLDSLLSQAQSLGVSQSVHFIGFTSNPYCIIKRAEAFILSSRHEGMPTVLVEAMYLNTPVIAFDCPTGPSELISHNKTGILVEAMNTDALAHAMCSYSRLTTRVTSDSVSHFSYASVAAAYISQFG